MALPEAIRARWNPERTDGMTAKVRDYNRDRLNSAMDDLGLDAVVASSSWNVSYLSGVSLLFGGLLTFLATTRDGRQGLVINEADAYFMRDASTIKDIRDYPFTDTVDDMARQSATLLAEMLSDLGLENGRIGLEDDVLPQLY